jgi:ribonuclease R
MEELRDRIVEYLQAHPKGKRKLDDIQEGLGLNSSSDFAALSKELDAMEAEYLVFRSQENQYETREQAGIVEGRLSINRAGMGFVDREDRDSIKVDLKDQNTALDGDTVLVQCQPWQVYGSVLTVLQRAREHVIGTFVSSDHGMQFVPDDAKLQSALLSVKYAKDFTPIEGMKVLCNITRYGTPLVLTVVQTIGYKDDPGVDITSILLDHDIVAEFPEEVMEQVHTIPQEVPAEDLAGRTDLTNENTVTIDGDDSKDFDDAVGVVRNDKGWLLKVSIADVSHYVTWNSPLDLEARKRGCSTYVTDRVVPMLPHELSNGICSLNPHVIRLTLTAEMQINRKGEVKDYKIYPSYIRSTERMTYNNVNKILDGDAELQEQYKHLGTLFTDLANCADAIRSARNKKGAINFASTEAEIKVDEKGHPIDIELKQRGHAEEMIEDCMIAANVTVANFLKWQDIPAIYRIHEEPSAKRIKSFVNMSEQMGHKLIVGKSDIYPNELQRYLDSVSDSDEYEVLSMMLLRCMQKARYDSRCVGHFGLAEDEYLHFTSPIRRYPDLVVHRMLRKYSFEQNTDLEERKNDEKLCQEYAEQSSVRERESSDAEFDCDDMKKAEYMQDHIGEKYEGIITGVQGYGFYVELPNTVEGLVRISSLTDDYYSYNPDRMELVGQRRKRMYRLGMKVNVVVLGASKEDSTIDFGLTGKNGKVLVTHKDQKDKRTARKTHRRNIKEGRKGNGRRKKH